MIAVVAHVIANSRSARNGPPDVDQLVEVRRHGWREHQAGRNPDGAVGKAGVDRAEQCPSLLGRQGPSRLPRDRDAQREVTHQRRGVERQGAREGPRVPGEIGPGPVTPGSGSIVGAPHASFSAGRRQRDAAHPAIAVHLGRHALANLAPGPSVAQQGHVRMAVQVDPAGRNDTPRGVDPRGVNRLVREIADRRDPVSCDADIRPRRGAPLPSTTVPPAMTRSRTPSSRGDARVDRRHDLADQPLDRLVVVRPADLRAE